MILVVKVEALYGVPAERIKEFGGNGAPGELQVESEWFDRLSSSCSATIGSGVGGLNGSFEGCRRYFHRLGTLFRRNEVDVVGLVSEDMASFSLNFTGWFSDTGSNDLLDISRTEE